MANGWAGIQCGVREDPAKKGKAMLTKKELDEMRARHEATTPGDWTDETLELETSKIRPDAIFISHAHQDVPDLLAHIAEQETRIDGLHLALERAQRRIDGLKGVDSTASVFEGR